MRERLIKFVLSFPVIIAGAIVIILGIGVLLICGLLLPIIPIIVLIYPETITFNEFTRRKK